jgi:tetratricopeptide (TPR) repeat protein
MWVGLIGVAATIPLVQTVAVAKSQVEVSAIAASISVLITSPNGQGSGVIFQQQGDIYTVITAAHVVKKKVSYKITTPDEKQYEVISSSIVSAPGDIDLAVVKFKATNKYPLAKLGNCNILARGMDLYVAGFPGRDRAITSSILVVREGKISANSNKTFDKGYSLIYSNDTMNGMSGGAVLNSNGELVAIHGIGDRDDDGRKNGFNLGIPIERFGTVASRMGVELNGQVAAISRDTTPKADDYFVSARQKYEKGDIKGALADYNRSIELNPNYTLTYVVRGRLKTDKLNDTQGALADYNRSIELKPDAYAYVVRGNLKTDKLNDIQAALADYNRATQLNPNYAYAYVARGSLKTDKLNDAQGALADYNRATQLKPDDAYYYRIRGSLKQGKLNDIQGALADYNRAIQLKPDDAYYYFIRGSLKQGKLNDIQGALADYNRAIQLKPDVDFYFIRGDFKYSKLNDAQGAIADYDRAIQLKPDADSYLIRGNFKYSKLNDAQGAIADYDRAIQLKPDADSYLIRGNFKYSKLNDAQGALADYNRAIQLKPDYAAGYAIRGGLKYAIGDLYGAIADNERAITINPNIASTHSNIGFIKYDLGDITGAIESWRKSLALSSNDDAQLGLAVALYRKGRASEAYKLGVEAIRKEKRSTNLEFLRKERKWSEIILKDAVKFLQTPTMMSIR